MKNCNIKKAELISENARLRGQIKELEELVRGLTRQLAEILQGSAKGGAGDRLMQDSDKNLTK